MRGSESSPPIGSHNQKLLHSRPSCDVKGWPPPRWVLQENRIPGWVTGKQTNKQRATKQSRGLSVLKQHQALYMFSQLDVVHWSLCQYSRNIKIKECHGLSSVIPSYAAGRMQKLQELDICECDAMEEVFETKEENNNYITDCSSSNIAVAIPRQKNCIVYKLSNLKTLKVISCDCLENIFTFSTLESLKKLEMLEIGYCKAMKVIVREEYGEGTTTSSKDVIIFPNLKSINLVSLPNLEGFYLGMNIDFQWLLLEDLMIKDCPQMMVFTSGWSTTMRLKYIHTQLGKHNVECDIVTPTLHQTPSPTLDCMRSRPTISDRKFWSFHNLIECHFDASYDDTKIFPSNELQQLQKLETITGGGSENLKEVFEVALEVTNNESQTVVKFPKLREVDIGYLRNLKYLWKSDQWRILEFPNLTKLSLRSCDSLEYVFTCSMVGCVMQLQELNIQFCTNMKVIVKKEDGDCDAKVSEIMFPCLKFLKLEYLPRMEGFCLGKEDFTFPSLDTLVISEIPMMTVFTEGRSITPELKVIETSFGSFNVNDGEDMNTFIMTKKQEGHKFGDRWF
ncbi:uncharacterized protein LOC143621912 [Bidens hawaiensis]|uniref:uncharacterized protein LOC143621912 n=1 Tax=Bidens hawaiensis TaxID=980011 RepID=UPI00404ABA33